MDINKDMKEYAIYDRMEKEAKQEKEKIKKRLINEALTSPDFILRGVEHTLDYGLNYSSKIIDYEAIEKEFPGLIEAYNKAVEAHTSVVKKHRFNFK